jgi:DNA-binding NarL/FixJ family response regulator
MKAGSVANGSHGTVSAIALIAEEDARDGIAAILESLGVSFTAFEDVEELLECPIEDDLRAILLWGGGESISPAPQIELLRERTATPVVVVCAALARWEVRAALAAGAAGLVLEDEMADTLGPCLEAAQAGLICVPRQHARQVEPPALSTREKQILGLVVMGYMNSQIAERLFLAESTVKSHLSSAFGKLGVRSRNEAVSLILDSKQGLGMGILGLGGEPLEAAPRALR